LKQNIFDKKPETLDIIDVCKNIDVYFVFYLLQR